MLHIQTHTQSGALKTNYLISLNNSRSMCSPLLLPNSVFWFSSAFQLVADGFLTLISILRLVLKACILVWDIGIPSAPEYRTRHQLLMRLICPRANLNPVLNLVFLPKFDVLLAGCEDGVFSWNLPEFRKEKLNEER